MPERQFGSNRKTPRYRTHPARRADPQPRTGTAAAPGRLDSRCLCTLLYRTEIGRAHRQRVRCDRQHLSTSTDPDQRDRPLVAEPSRCGPRSRPAARRHPWHRRGHRSVSLYRGRGPERALRRRAATLERRRLSLVGSGRVFWSAPESGERLCSSGWSMSAQHLTRGPREAVATVEGTDCTRSDGAGATVWNGSEVWSIVQGTDPGEVCQTFPGSRTRAPASSARLDGGRRVAIG